MPTLLADQCYTLSTARHLSCFIVLLTAHIYSIYRVGEKVDHVEAYNSGI